MQSHETEGAKISGHHRQAQIRFQALHCALERNSFCGSSTFAASTVKSWKFHPFGLNKPASVTLPKGCASIAAGLDLTKSPTIFSGPVAETPPMGYSSYPLFGAYVNQQDIMAIATAMVNNNMAAAGYRYVDIDDGWQGHRVNGILTANPTRFPCGIKLVADYLHAKGLKLGLYTTRGKFPAAAIWAHMAAAGVPGGIESQLQAFGMQIVCDQFDSTRESGWVGGKYTVDAMTLPAVVDVDVTITGCRHIVGNASRSQ